MKKLTVLVFAIVLGSIQVFASNDSPVITAQHIRNEVAVLLKNPEINVETIEITAYIQFTINANGEVVVLNVDSNEDLVISYVKTRLNYKKVTVEKSINVNRVFNLPLKIKRPENI